MELTYRIWKKKYLDLQITWTIQLICSKINYNPETFHQETHEWFRPKQEIVPSMISTVSCTIFVEIYTKLLKLLSILRESIAFLVPHFFLIFALYPRVLKQWFGADLDEPQGARFNK